MGDASRRWGMPGWFCRGTSRTGHDRSPVRPAVGRNGRGLPVNLQRVSVLVAAVFGWLVWTATASANPLPVAGIYQVWANDSAATAPYVRGGQITLDWATIEPQAGLALERGRALRHGAEAGGPAVLGSRVHDGADRAGVGADYAPQGLAVRVHPALVRSAPNAI